MRDSKEPSEQGSPQSPLQSPSAIRSPASPVPPPQYPPWNPPPQYPQQYPPPPLLGLAPPPPIAPPPERPHRRRRNWAFGGLALAVVLIMVGALLVWAPWVETSPGIPRSVNASGPTATSILVKWTPAASGAHAKSFLITRDGHQVATVPAGRLSYLDQGLRPGTKHRYSVVAQSGSRRSASSVVAVATTTIPVPVGLTAGAATPTTLTFTWSPPPASPVPDSYVISRDGTVLEGGVVEGTVTSYRDTGLKPATTYRYDVSAIWTNGSDDAVSDSSPAIVMRTSNPPKPPPVSAARLTGSRPIDFKVVSSTGGLTVGTAWSNTWVFTPKCASGPCDVTLSGVVAPAGYADHSFALTLVRNGAVYTGGTTAHITHCGQTPNVVDVQNPITVNITVQTGALSGTTWSAKALTGTMQIDSPYTSAGQYYCSQQTFTASLAAS